MNSGDSILKTRYDDHLSRKFFHIFSGTIVCFLFIYVFDRKSGAITLFSGCSIFLFLDLTRLKFERLNVFLLKIFGGLMRKEEAHRLSAQFYYILGMAYAVGLLPRAIAIQTLLTLAWMDPVAGIIGVRFGKHTWNSIFQKVFYDIPHFPISMGAKTLEGSGAGFFAAVLAGIVAWTGPWASFPLESGLWWPSPFIIISMSVVGGLIATIAEAWPSQWDDNVNIPFWTGLFVWMTAVLIGIPYRFL